MDLSQIPALDPPEGVVPNFIDPPKDNTGAYAVLAICLVLSTAAILSRVYSRVFVVRQIFLADYLLFPGYVIYLAIIGICYKVAHSPGFYVHQWDVSLALLVPYLHSTFVGVILFCVFMGLVKTAILLEWLRIFLPHGKAANKTLYYLLHAVLWANLLFYVAMIIVQNIACTPYEFTWNRTIPGGSCKRVNTNLTDLSSAIINLVVDVCILVIPQHVIWRLMMSQQKKLGVAVLFVIGLLGVITAAFRVLTTVRALANHDFVYNFGPVILCCLAEGTCAILVVCGPTMPKALQQLTVQLPVLSRISSSVRSLLRTSSSDQGSTNRSYPNHLSNGGPLGSNGHHTTTIGGSIWPPRGPGSGFGSAKAKAYSTLDDEQGHSLESLEAKTKLHMADGNDSLPRSGQFELAGNLEHGRIVHSREFEVTRTDNNSSSDGVSAFGHRT
ncbi:hypothetical protein V8F33_010317 [Rhypophila sp. PSN 637]